MSTDRIGIMEPSRANETPRRLEGCEGMSAKEFFSIVAMQGFNGLSTFCVLLLMALGLAIIFGQMGVINMAHGEFLTIGAYTTYGISEISQRWAPWLQKTYSYPGDGRRVRGRSNGVGGWSSGSW